MSIGDCDRIRAPGPAGARNPGIRRLRPGHHRVKEDLSLVVFLRTFGCVQQALQG